MQRTIVGMEQLRSSGYEALAGKRCATLVHSASALPDTLIHTVDALAHAPKVQLSAILAPEHGFRGDRQAEHGDPKPYIDKETGIWVHSVYRKSPSALASLLRDFDVVVVDLQDVGTRLYTFVWTLYTLMQAAAIHLSKPPTFLIADRPNPLGGLAVEGPILNVSCCASRYGYAAVPHRHSLTVGEAAQLFADSIASSSPPSSSAPPQRLNVTVIPMKHWRRSMLFRDTGLPWLPPSPNLPTAESAVAYAAAVFVEATTASEGRGTTTPFQLIGAPFLNASQLAARLATPRRARGSQADVLPQWREAFFMPTWFKWNKSVCNGAQFVRPNASHSLFRDGVHLLAALRAVARPPSAFQWDGRWFGQPGSILIDRYAGTPQLRELLDAGETPDAVADAFVSEAATFAKVTRLPYLLYD